MNTEIKRYNFTIDSNHSDLEILCKHTGTSPGSKGSSSSSSSISGTSVEANYMRVYSLRYWEPSDIEKLKEAFEAVNQLTAEYNFEYSGYMDYEVEYDNDRSWPASFGFRAVKKINQSEPSK